MKILIGGSHGLVGTALIKSLETAGHEIFRLVRHAPSSKTEVEWSPDRYSIALARIEGFDAVVNLAGESIASGRWTSARKKTLRDSRLNSTRVLVGALASAAQKPKLLVNASAVGFYGDVPNGDVTENSLKGTGFLPDLCAEWEAEAKKAEASGLRVVLLRLGVVLEREGGALQKFLPPFNFFVGGPLGSGRQYFPWVHRGDVVGAVLFALQNPSLSGPVNVVSPGVLTMSGFCLALGRAMGRPSWAPVPGFVLKILLGEMSEMLLGGQKVLPARLEKAGYKFRYPEAESALRQILKK